MPAYGALVSLNFTIEQHEQRSTIFPDSFQIESLKRKISFLQRFFENYSQVSGNEIVELKRLTADVVYFTELLIESHASDQMLTESGYRGENCSKFFSGEKIPRLMAKFDSITEKAMEIIDATVNEVQLPRSFTSKGPPRSAPLESNAMVGFDEDLIQVMQRITRPKSHLQILPIVGMAGIGKTTLAQCVYDNQHIKDHFHIRLWSTVSHSCDVHNIFLSFQHDPFGVNVDYELNLKGTSLLNEESQRGSNGFGEELYKTLFGRRYLVVLDDIWTAQVWTTIRKYFPNNCNGSCIIVTTRLLSVAADIGADPYELQLLDRYKSWALFKKRVFAEDGCPFRLEDIGRKIAASCNGLPLAIVVIAGQLAKSDMTKKSWENVARSLTSAINSENDNECLKILSLSYDNLPVHLKPCFLCMGVYPVDSMIRVSILIKIWVAEGFLKPIGDKFLEDTAMKYLTDLVGRNLISVIKRGSSGKIKYIQIHDLLRDLCLRKAYECNFLASKRWHGAKSSPGIETQFHRNLCHMDVKDYPPNLRLVRSVYFEFSDFELASLWVSAKKENVELFRRRHIVLSAAQVMDISTCSLSFASLSKLRNLQTLIMIKMAGSMPVLLPSQVWEMAQLRHLDIRRVVLPDPPISESHCVLKYLQTLVDVHDFKLSEKVLRRIPNLKKLRISYGEASKRVEWPYYCLDNLVKLSQLESFHCSMYGRISTGLISFPPSLRKLTLDGCQNPWEDMEVIGLLPNLEVLRLRNDAFSGTEWRPIAGQFYRLKALYFQNMSLELWEADSIHFPRLESLVFCNVWKLKEVPVGIGDIETLKSISLELCSASLYRSIQCLIEEQESIGNNSIYCRGPWQETMELLPRTLGWMLECNSTHAFPNPRVQVDNLESDLFQLNSFINYTIKKVEKDETLKELLRQIQDVMYDANDIIHNAQMHAPGRGDPDAGVSFTYSLRRLLCMVKEVEYVSVKVQRAFLSMDNGDLEENKCTNPVNFVSITNDVEAVSSGVQCIFHGFARLTVADGISEENEVYEHKDRNHHNDDDDDDVSTMSE